MTDTRRVVCEPCQGTGLLTRYLLTDARLIIIFDRLGECPQCLGDGVVRDGTSAQITRAAP